MKEPILVILAAGLGSRYGGLKQIDAIGNNGESIIDFSIYDAYQAGFRRLVLIIRKEHEELFNRQISDKIRPFMEITYAYQDVKDLPGGFVCPAERTKPWGTVQAVLSTKDVVDAPFMVINADDFYGRESYEIMYHFLKEEVKDDVYGMVGYQLSKTLTDNGSVTRGVCQTENGYLSKIVEVQKIIRKEDKPYAIINDVETPLEDGIASMNFWGFTPSIFAYLEKYFKQFLAEKLTVEKSELVIPTTIADMINANETKVKVMSTSAEWFGVTYPQDREAVANKMINYKAAGIYPFDLWK